MNIYESLQSQIRKIANEKQISDKYINYLVHSDRVIEVNIPVQMDDWSVQNFVGYRSQHNNIRWPYKWGIRFHPSVSRHEVMALSTWMSMKVAVVDLPLGGWKWWVIVDPKKLSTNELEKLSRWYVSKIYKYIWPDTDVPAPDVNTNGEIMAWMMDEYSDLVWTYSPGSFTWKPVDIWWSNWRSVATAKWWMYVFETYLKNINQNIKNQKIALQWAGNVGLNFAKMAYEKWAKIVAISDSSGWVYDEDGLDMDEIYEIKTSWNSVTSYDTQGISNSELLEIDTDVLVLAALENQINDENKEKIKVDHILELANGPISQDAIDYLDWQIPIIPDILANAGGVTVSYFEQVQNSMNYYWWEKEVFEKLNSIMVQATKEVLQYANRNKLSYRKSAYHIAIDRILDAMRKRKNI